MRCTRCNAYDGDHREGCGEPEPGTVEVGEFAVSQLLKIAQRFVPLRLGTPHSPRREPADPAAEILAAWTSEWQAASARAALARVAIRWASDARRWTVLGTREDRTLAFDLSDQAVWEAPCSEIVQAIKTIGKAQDQPPPQEGKP